MKRMSFSFQKLKGVLIASFEMGHCSPRNADSGFLAAMTQRWDQLPGDCHQSPLCPCVHGLSKVTERVLGMYRERGWKWWSGGSHPNILSSREDPCSTAAPSWIWVVERHPRLAGRDGGDDTCPEQPDSSCSFTHCSRPAAALLPGRKPGRFGSWMKCHRTCVNPISSRM